MATKLKDNPKVQALVASVTAKATKEQEKAVKAATKAAIDAAKNELDEAIAGAKEAGDKSTVKALGDAKKAVLAAIKGK